VLAEDPAVFRNDLSPAQEKTQLTGRALDAALADPRWEVQPEGPIRAIALTQLPQFEFNQR
jgi:hypothetical protein